MSLTADQLEGACFLSRSTVAMLADVPGLGKTAQVVRACDMLDVRAATILVPNQTLAVNFAAEFEKWSLLGHDTCVMRTGKDAIPERGIVFVTYTLAARPDVAKRLARRRVDVLACDEAHALKSPTSKRTKAVMRKTGLLGAAARVWLMTGTPVPNHAGELYVFAKCCGAFDGSFKQFAERYCILAENSFGLQIVGSKNHAELKALLAPYFLRRTEVHGRPPLTIDIAYVEGSKDVDPYSELTAEDRASIEHAISTGDWSLADVPAVATVRRLVGMAKADGIAELTAGALEAGFRKVLTFCRHTDVINRVASQLGSDAAIFDGHTPQRERERISKAFQSEPWPRVIVAQTLAGGEGNTWTAANRVFLGEPEWVPKDNEQPIARAWRRGQIEPVLASFVALKGSLDGRITAAAHRKTIDASRLM